MRKRDALRLHNRDDVEVRTAPGEWSPGYVLGEPKVYGDDLVIPVQTKEAGYQEVSYTEVR